MAAGTNRTDTDFNQGVHVAWTSPAFAKTEMQL
jgi:hypothetical protein